MKTNFVGLRQRNLRKQSNKHRMQGVIITSLIFSLLIGLSIYFILPKVRENAGKVILENIERNKVEVIVSRNDLEFRENINNNYEIKKIDKNLVPEKSLKLTDIKDNLVVTRNISKNSILTLDEVIPLTNLIPDLRRYEEFDGLIEIPRGIEQYMTEKQETLGSIIVDFRFRFLDNEKNIDLDEVILSKKEIPLLIGNTIWFALKMKEKDYFSIRQ